MKKRIFSMDFTVIITVILLMGAGFFTLYSATDDEHKLTVQLFCYIAGFFAMITMAFWDYRSLNSQKNLIYLMCILGLLAVFLFGIGKEQTGAKSWIRFGGIGVQPSEFVKLLFCVYLSYELSEGVEKDLLNRKSYLTLTLVKCTVIIALVILQNDTGTALVFVFAFCVALFISGISAKYIIFAVLAALILLPVVWLCLADYQKDRLVVFLNPSADLSDSGYQVNFSKLALASGGISGKGYRQGAVNTLSYLPEKETDFIFSVIGEEFGFFGTITILILFFILVLRCFFIAKHAVDLQGSILATSVASIFLFHIMENIGMTLGLLPVTGIPLPFLSYGGSAVLSMSLGAGLILCVEKKAYNLYHS